MMELADVAALAFIAFGLIFQSVRCYRGNRYIKMKRKFFVNLQLHKTELAGDYSYGIVLVFDRLGHLVRKLPEVDVKRRKDQCKLCCSVEEGLQSFYVLFASHPLSLSSVYHSRDLERLFLGNPEIQIAKTDIEDIKSNVSLQLVMVREDLTAEKQMEAVPVVLSMLLPPEVITDAMAKVLTFDLSGCNAAWKVGDVRYLENESEDWINLKVEGEKLVIQVHTNFSSNERTATVELYNKDHVHTLKVKQMLVGVRTGLNVARKLYVTTGQKNEIIPFTVTPDNEQVTWHIKSANANDGGCWYTVKPAIGVRQKGTQVLKVHLAAKPVNVRSRSLSLTVETGTYPFCQTVDIIVMQGICFNYYIEYPQDDICARHSEVIETPLDYKEADGLKTYIVCVNSNQAWHVVCDEKADWIEVGKPEILQGHYGGRFIVKVHSNEGNRERGGFPAARYTVLSLINDTGIVKDILIYQGGYVRISGKYWLDRNLSSEGKLAQVAVPVGFDENCTLNHGSYFQFGSRSEVWNENYTPCKGSWYRGTPETPSRSVQSDPSPIGWRIPSYIEMESFINVPAASLELQCEENKNNICFLSDDGVPVYLPLCGHRSHINGCLIMIPHGHRYWTGSSQRAVYGYSLCVESNRQMYIVHDMKKCGFPVRCILE